MKWGSECLSLGDGVARDTLELMLDLIFQDSARWCDDAGGLGISRLGVASEEDLFRYKVYGSAFAYYIYATGRLRTVSFWTLAVCIIGKDSLDQLMEKVSIIKRVDPDTHRVLEPWTCIDENTILQQGGVTKDGTIIDIHQAIESLLENDVYVAVSFMFCVFLCSFLTFRPASTII